MTPRRLLVANIVGPIVAALAGGVLTWRTRRRLPVRTDFLLSRVHQPTR